MTREETKRAALARMKKAGVDASDLVLRPLPSGGCRTAREPRDNYTLHIWTIRKDHSNRAELIKALHKAGMAAGGVVVEHYYNRNDHCELY